MSKQTKQRSCPALGRMISSAECGGDRHRLIACTADCPHNPFAQQNYDSLLDQETDLDRSSLAALAAEIGRERVQRIMHGSGGAFDEVAANAAIIREIFVRRDAQGRSFAERWLASSPRELKNDARFFLAAKARMRPAVLEVQEIRPDGLIRAVDLLAPEAGDLLVLDRMTWARAARFQRLFVWTYPLPHFHRMCGAGIAWPEWLGSPVTPPEALREIVAHLGGPGHASPNAERRTWVAENFDLVKEALFAVSDARRRSMFEQIDAAYGWREFVLPKTTSTALVRKLEAGPDVYPDVPDDDDRAAGLTSAWAWCEPPSSEDPPGRRRVLGRVASSGTTWRLRGMGRDRIDRLQAAFLALAGTPQAAPQREFLQDLGRKEAANIDAPDARLVPPTLLEHPAKVDFSTSIATDPQVARADALGGPEGAAVAVEAAAVARWVDEPVPGLGGRTPREAVRDPDGRARTIAMLKERIRDFDAECLRGRRRADPMTIVRELGLHELDLPAPPPRPLVSVPGDDNEDALSDENDEIRFPGPAFHALSNEEILDRMLLVKKHAPDDQLLDLWDEEFPELADLVDEVAFERLSDEEAEKAVYHVALAWFALGGMDVPTSHAFNKPKLRLAFEDRWAQLESLRDADTVLARLETFCPGQPAVLRGIFVLDAHSSARQVRLTYSGLLIAASLIDVLVNELARVARES